MKKFCQICGQSKKGHDGPSKSEIEHPFIDSSKELSKRVSKMAYHFIQTSRQQGHDYLPPQSIAWLLYGLLDGD